ncbi:MAG: hypothetical protein WAK24_14105 [Candidatus Acidiferrales bacterium]
MLNATQLVWVMHAHPRYITLHQAITTSLRRALPQLFRASAYGLLDARGEFTLSVVEKRLG